MDEAKIKARMERQEKISAMVKSGSSLADIAKLWNVNYGMIIYDVNKMPPSMRKEIKDTVFSGRRKLTFTDTEIQTYSNQLLELSKTNKSIQEITAAFNKPISFVRKLLKKMPKEIRDQIRFNIKGQRRNSANKKSQIEQLVREGKKQSEIAQIMGIKQNTVSCHIQRLPPKIRKELKKLMRQRKAKEDAERWAKRKEEQKIVPPEIPQKPAEITVPEPSSSSSG